jgi:ComF family protein
MASQQWWGNATGFMVDFIYPRRCGGCGERGTWLCNACNSKLERFSPPWCARCGVSTHINRCSCSDLATEINWARSIGPFEGWLRGAIVQLKYHGEWSRGQHLAEVLAPVILDLPIDILVPVPLHQSRLKRRGFNQSLVLATELAPFIDAAVEDCFIRTRRTPSQTTLDAAARRGNVAGAFGLAEVRDYSGLSVALVDDVLTTGSTIGECARVLQASGAASIGAITLARELS